MGENYITECTPTEQTTRELLDRFWHNMYLSSDASLSLAGGNLASLYAKCALALAEKEKQLKATATNDA